MKSKSSVNKPRNPLRQQAEQRVRKPHADTFDRTRDDLARLLYELEVHQEELLIQNEELRQVHQELMASRDRYADLYDFAPVGYVSVNELGQIMATNLTATTMLGIERSKLLGTRLAILCDIPSRTALHIHLEKVLSSKILQTCELTFHRPDGITFHARLDSRIADAPAATQIRIVITDIGEQKAIQRALLEKDKHLRTLGDALPVLIGYLNAEFQYQYANATHGDWFAMSPDELIGENIQDVLGDEAFAEIVGYLEDALNNRQMDFPLNLVHKQKGLRQVQVMLVPDRGPNGNVQGIHLLAIDVTEHKIVEEQNARRRRFAEKLRRLNAEEGKVYDLLIRGKSNKVIATDLDIGLRTVVRRRQIIFEKLEVETLADLLQELANIQGF